MTIAALTASEKICEILVKQGIEPIAFFWHYEEDHPEGKRDSNGNIEKVFNVYEVEKAVYKPGILIPAWTFEELYIMLGGDHDKPDLLRQKDVQVLNNAEEQVPYYNYQYSVISVSSMRNWKRGNTGYSQGAQAVAELLRDHLARTPKEKLPAELKLINDRYKYFFNYE